MNWAGCPLRVKTLRCPSQTGTLLAGRYRTIERVGSGGMATVLLAEDERLGRQVAVKRLHAESPEDTAQRFRREAKLGASLNHPNLVAVYDIVTDDEGVLIVMEYVDGETLRDAIERGPLEPARAIEVLRGMAEALDHAHGEGIVHRDVKPANVLLGARRAHEARRPRHRHGGRGHPHHDVRHRARHRRVHGARAARGAQARARC